MLIKMIICVLAVIKAKQGRIKLLGMVCAASITGYATSAYGLSLTIEE